MKLKHASIFSLLTFPLKDILVYYSISSLQDGMVIFIKKVGLRVGLKDLNKYIPGRANYKEQRRRSVFVRLSNKTRRKSEI